MGAKTNMTMCEKCDEHCLTISELGEKVKYLNEQLAIKSDHVSHLQGVVQSGKLEVNNMHAVEAYLKSVAPLPMSTSQKATGHLLSAIDEHKKHIEHLKSMVDGSQIKALHDRCEALEKLLSPT